MSEQTFHLVTLGIWLTMVAVAVAALRHRGP